MKKESIRIFALILVLAMAFAVVGCGSTEPAVKTGGTQTGTEASGTEAVSTEGHYKIGLSISDKSLPFFGVIESVIREKIEANGDTLVAVDAGNDLQTQINQIEDLIAQDIDILLLIPRDNKGVLPALVACKDAGIPVISVDQEPFDTEYLTSHVASDNYDCGKVIGTHMAKILPEGSKILVIQASFAESITNRVKGMKEAAEAAGVTYDYIDVEYTGDQEPLTLIEDALQANSDLDAIYGPYEAFSLAAAAAVQSARLNIPVFGVDASPSEKAAIKEGAITATAAQSPYKIGDQVIITVYDVLKGVEVENRYLIPSFIVDANNVDEYGTTDWQ